MPVRETLYGDFVYFAKPGKVRIVEALDVEQNPLARSIPQTDVLDEAYRLAMADTPDLPDSQSGDEPDLQREANPTTAVFVVERDWVGETLNRQDDEALNQPLGSEERVFRRSHPTISMDFASLEAGDFQGLINLFNDIGAIPSATNIAASMRASQHFDSRLSLHDARSFGVDWHCCWLGTVLRFQSQLATCLTLAQAIREKDRELLKNSISFSGPMDYSRVTVVVEGLVKGVCPEKPYLGCGIYLAKDDVVDDWLVLGSAVLAELMNNLLSSHTQLSIVSDIDRLDRRPLRVEVTPLTLLGAIACQFAQGLTTGDELRRCDHCGKSFWVSLEDFRPTKRFCSDRCKVREYRKRKDRAVILSQSGMSPAQIAQELETDTKTVRGWIKAKVPSKKTTSRTRRKRAE